MLKIGSLLKSRPTLRQPCTMAIMMSGTRLMTDPRGGLTLVGTSLHGGRTAAITTTSPPRSRRRSAVAEQKARAARGFVQARQAIKARNLSRGFYSFYSHSPGSKSGVQGQMKAKRKRVWKAQRSQLFDLYDLFVASEDPGGFLGAAVGDPSYSGRFICGDKSHDFRSCPKRNSARSGK